MVALVEDKILKEVSPRKVYSIGDKISKKYRKAAIKKAEYRKLKAIVPSVANEKTVSKLTVIEEAIKYIDQLHAALVRKVLTTDFNNNNNNNDNEIDGNTVLNNLQRSCDNKTLPFSCADDFIKNFILQQHPHFDDKQETCPEPQTHRRHVAVKHSANTQHHPLVEKSSNLFPRNVDRIHQDVRPMSQVNATLSTDTILSSSSSSLLPKVATVSRRALITDPIIELKTENLNLRAKRMLF